MAEVEPPDHIKLLYCYDPSDKKLRDVLEKHLKALRRVDFIENWSDLNIQPGTERKVQIEEHLRTADIILLLISADFLEKDYNYEVLIESAIKRHYAGEAYVVPILLRPVHLEGTPLNRLMRLPSSDKPVITWAVRDAAFVDIVQGIHRILKDVWLKKGDAHYKAKRYDRALDAFEKAIFQDPEFGAAHSRRGCVLHDLGYYYDALVSLKTATNLDPMDAYAHYLLGTVLYDCMDYEKAITSLSKAVQLNHLLVSAYIYMGLTLERQGMIGEAFAVYDSYLKLHPHDPLIAYFRRDLYNRTASKDFQREAQDFGERFAYSFRSYYEEARRYYDEPSRKRPADIEEAPLLAFMQAFRRAVHEFQQFALQAASKYSDFLNNLRRGLHGIVNECNVVENQEIRNLLLTILTDEERSLTMRRNFIGALIDYLRDLERREIRDIDRIIEEWNHVLDKVIEELEARYKQSQVLLNALRAADCEGLFQIKVEEDKSQEA